MLHVSNSLNLRSRAWLAWYAVKVCIRVQESPQHSLGELLSTMGRGQSPWRAIRLQPHAAAARSLSWPVRRHALAIAGWRAVASNSVPNTVDMRDVLDAIVSCACRHGFI
jgi:hypothetical protein